MQADPNLNPDNEQQEPDLGPDPEVLDDEAHNPHVMAQNLMLTMARCMTSCSH